jgi:hypothetical protein
MATLLDPSLLDRAFNPTAMLCPPSFVLSAPYPTAVLFRVPVAPTGPAFGLVFAELYDPMVVFPFGSLTHGPLNDPKFNAID